MKKSYYLFNPGRMSRKDNTLKFVATDVKGQVKPAKYLPVEGVENLYVFGALDANSSLYTFLGKKRISVHFFDYYEHYSGSFMPKEYLLAGKVQLEQSRFYLKPKWRIEIAQKFIEGAAFNMIKNLRYYHSRGKETLPFIEQMESYARSIDRTNDIAELMGIEGNIRQVYYKAFNVIVKGFEMAGRNKQPPKDPINALISFGNMMCYTTCLDVIYHTQLNPTIGFLHEPGYRRYTLALDLAEIFKPILVDRVIFKVINKRIIQKDDFDKQVNQCLLNQKGKQKFIRHYEERLKETILHRSLNKKISYKRLVQLECYKLTKHLLKIQNYEPFKIWW